MATVTWNIDTDGLWSTASDWSTGFVGGTLPATGDDVIIDTPDPHTVTLDPSVGFLSVNNLTLGSNDSLGLIGTDFTVNGIVGSTLQVTGNFVTPQGVDVENGTLDLSSATAIDCDSITLNAPDGYSLLNTGTQDFSVGSFMFGLLTSTIPGVGGSNQFYLTLESAGTITVTGSAYLNGHAEGTGTLLFLGASGLRQIVLEDGQTLDNQGTMSSSDNLAYGIYLNQGGGGNEAGPGTIWGSGFNVFDNDAQSTIDLFNSNFIEGWYNTDGVNNSGVVIFEANTIDNSNDPAIEPYLFGTIAVGYFNNMGTLISAGNGVQVYGNFTLVDSETVINSVGTFNNSGGAFGIFTFNTDVTNAAAGVISGTATHNHETSSGALIFNGSLTNSGTLTSVAAGGIQVNGTGNIVAGLVNGTGTVAINGVSTLSDVTIDGSIVLANSSTLELHGLTDNDALILNNFGIIDQTAQITFAAGSTLTNGHGETYKLDGDVGLGTPGAMPQFTNGGNLEKTTGKGVSVVDAIIANTGAIWAQTGTLSLANSVIGTGGLLVSSAADLLLAGPTIDSGQTLDFVGAGATATIGTGTTFQGTIEGLLANDVIDVQGVEFGGTFDKSYTPNAGNTQGTLSLSDGVHSINLTILGSYALGDFTPSGDAEDGTVVTFNQLPCFAQGTRLMAAAGIVAVEQLRPGDEVVLAAGGTRPVAWIGFRTVDVRAHPRPEDVLPVCVKAAAFGVSLPHADLRLSPDHAVFVDGALIPIRYLINGSTIIQEAVDELTYWHVELDRHDVLLAEGLPCESFLDTGNRAAFANGGVVAQIHPDFTQRLWDGDACAPLVVAGPQLEAVRIRLSQRAARLAGCQERRSLAPVRSHTA